MAEEKDKYQEESKEYKNFADVKEIPGKSLGIRNKHIEALASLDSIKKNELFQSLSFEIKRQIEEVKKKMDAETKQKSDNEKTLLSLDEEIPDLKLKIQEKKEDLAKKGINLEDKSNAFVKELSNLEDQYAIKNEIKDTLKKENQTIDTDIKDDEKIIDELSKQSRLIEKSIELNDKERIKEAQDKAEKKVGDGRLLHQQSAILTALEALMIASEQFAKIREAREDAAKEMKNQIDQENSTIISQEKEKVADTDLQDEELPKMEDHISGECMVYMAHTAEGKDIVRIMDANQAVEFANSDECENIRKAIKEEESLPIDQRKTSVISLKVENKEALLKELEPTVKKAVNFAEELHEYISTADKMKSVKETLLEKCNIEQAIGANHYSQFTSKNIDITDLNLKPTNETKKLSVEDAVKEISELVQKNEESMDKAFAESIEWKKKAAAISSRPNEAEPEKKEEVNVVEFSSITNGYVQSTRKVPADRIEVVGKEPKWNLWNFIKDKLHISKEYITPEDQKRLMAGEVTSMYFTEDGRQCRLRPISDPLTKTISCEIEYKRSQADYIGLKRALNLDDRDVENLKRVGVLDHAISYQGKDVLIYKDKETNNFLCVDKDSIKIDNKLHEMLNEKEVRQLKEGIPVHCANLIDKQGQRYNGWVLIDPSTRSAVVSKKKPAFVDNDYKIQVANNNNGQRAESVKDDKDPVLKSKQSKNDDGPKPQESKQQYKDYSEDDKSITETTTTKSKKLK